MRRIVFLLVVLAFALMVLPSARGEVVEKPFTMTLRPTTGEVVRGKLVAWDDGGVDIEVAQGETKRVEWGSLAPRYVLDLHKKLLKPEEADRWFAVGVMLYGREDGERQGELALRSAVEADPQLAALADQVRAGEQVKLPGAEEEEAENGEGGPESSGPMTVGTPQSKFWGELDAKMMSDSEDQLVGFAQETQDRLAHRLKRYDNSKVFLFYTDLPPAEARQWSGVLDRMYEELCTTFGVAPEVNLFRGKALVFVFKRPEDYRRFQMTMHHTNPGTSAGMCHTFGDGRVHIAFYRQGKELDFAHVLVHEAVHGFLHRYRSYPSIPSWVNEGLAEYVAARLITGRSDPQEVKARVRRELINRRTLGGNFFTGTHIEAWHYPVAQLMCDYMLSQDRTRYKAFIDAIKDGKRWDLALLEDYGTTVEKLTEGFSAKLGVRGLRP